MARFERKKSTVPFREGSVAIQQLSAGEKREWGELAATKGNRDKQLDAIFVAVRYGLDPQLSAEEVRDVPEDLIDAVMGPILELSGVKMDLAQPAPGKNGEAVEEGAESPKD